MNVDEARLNDLLTRAVGDFGGGMQIAMGLIGDRLGLYRSLHESGPATPADLAQRTQTAERYVREWLNNQAAGGYVDYDAPTGRYSLSPEQASVLTDENSAHFLPGGFQVIYGALQALPRVLENFHTGQGMDWGEHHRDVFEGTARFFRPGYTANLVTSWIPSLEGVQERMESGADVADVGCGHGASTLLMAQAFPRSRFVGFDSHAPSVEAATKRARQEGLASRVRFEKASASDYPGRYDLIAFFDCLHDMADPAGAARYARGHLKESGTWMIVEPFANERPEENHNPVGRIFYGASTMLCVPCSLHGNGPALGAQAPEGRLREVVVDQGGFGHFRRAAETPFNRVYEARA